MDISGTYSTEIGSFKVTQIGSVFFVKYKRENCYFRNSPWICSLSGIGKMSLCKESKLIFLQMFFGITNPILIIELFLLTFVILSLAGWEILSIGFLISASAIITTGVAALTFFATALSEVWRAESKAIKKFIKELFEQ